MLFGRDNFFKDLEFYNIKGMTDSMFRRLKVFYDHALFKPETVKDGSVAAASLCMWVRAVYEYAVVYRTLKPKQKQIKEAEKEMEEVIVPCCSLLDVISSSGVSVGECSVMSV